MHRILAVVAAGLAVLLAPAAEAQKQRQTPYWASISAGKALMRSGPGKNYPSLWLYRRADLPIRVTEIYQNWRKIEDPDGTSGWMLVNLLSDTRTAIVTGDELRPMHEKPDANSKVRYFAEPGVVGRLSECEVDWCEMNVRGRQGYIRTQYIWGVSPGETF